MELLFALVVIGALVIAFWGVVSWAVATMSSRISEEKGERDE